MLAIFAEHAATAIRTANLIDRQNRQLAGLARIVSGLREQTHEHANRIHSISALLALGEHDKARRFIAQLLSVHDQSHDAVVAGIEHPTLAGLPQAEMAIIHQRGIALKVDRRSRLAALPAPDHVHGLERSGRRRVHGPRLGRAGAGAQPAGADGRRRGR